MEIHYFALVCGGGLNPENQWDKDVEVSGEDMDIKEAIEKIEKDLPPDAEIVEIQRLIT